MTTTAFKNIVMTLCIGLAAIVYSVDAKAQFSFAGDPFAAPESTLILDEIPTLQSFSVQYYDHVVYLQWTIKGESADCLYSVERSADGINYSTVALKRGIGTPHTSVALLNCAQDSSAFAGTWNYRIRQMKEGVICNGPVAKITINDQPQLVINEKE